MGLKDLALPFFVAPGIGHFNYLAVPGVGIFEFFSSVTTNHFPRWRISVIFDLTFLPGGREFYSNFLENVKDQDTQKQPLKCPSLESP